MTGVTPDPATGGWSELVDAWRDYMRSAGTPSTTLGLRVYHLERVAAQLGGTPAAVTLDDLTAWLGAQDWAPNTRRSYRASLRSFYGWALATGRVTESPAHLLPAVRVPRGKPRPAPDAAFAFALRIADDRERLALMLGGRCGLRRGEIAKAQREDVFRDLVGWSIRVVGKGGHVRDVPLPDDLADLIRARPPGWLFPSPRGGHLTPHHLGKLVSALLDGNLTTHTLRHRCGTKAYEATRDLRAVQELLGHAKPETTAIYTAIPSASIRAAMEGAA